MVRRPWGCPMTLYVLGAPDGRVALLHLHDLSQWVDLQERMQPLRRYGRGRLNGIAVGDVVVLGISGLCGVVPELEAAERLVEGEGVASDRLARPPEQDTRACSDWFEPPTDWADRCRREDVGEFPQPRPLAELRDRGHLPRPRLPSDRRGAYAAVLSTLPPYCVT